MISAEVSTDAGAGKGGTLRIQTWCGCRISEAASTLANWGRSRSRSRGCSTSGGRRQDRASSNRHSSRRIIRTDERGAGKAMVRIHGRGLIDMLRIMERAPLGQSFRNPDVEAGRTVMALQPAAVRSTKDGTISWRVYRRRRVSGRPILESDAQRRGSPSRSRCTVRRNGRQVRR